MENQKAEKFFHNEENNWNCCQAVIKAYQDKAALNDEEIEKVYRPCGGGRAEGGLCGALYAGEQLMLKYGLPSIKDDFEKEAGATTCKRLKGELKFPCIECVRLSEKLISKRFKEAE